ncbi:MAG: hypothetical protein GYB53_21805 [Rhodobacteraceae bacterium]|uniref:hypothetical protein n=1 Tax=Oceanicola sp. S124 TaxID=1042378 RepID=UPI000255A69E|nr:hypothetical protein [Oceanicola sp. S124]MBR9766076.1 hypothetical protein [Paracoccaceae bacterium]
MADHTLTKEAACGSASWAAQHLGMSPRAFRDKRSALEAEGFPEPDPLLGRYLKADVRAWLEKRRRVSDSDKVTVGGERPSINLDAL